MTELVEELGAIPRPGKASRCSTCSTWRPDWNREHYEDAGSMYWRYADAVGYYTVPAERQVGALGFVDASS